MTTRISTAARNAQADAFAALLDGGSVKIYTGTQPANPDTATGEVLLATVVLENPAFTAASNGVITLVTPDTVISSAAGDVGWTRLCDSGGNGILDAVYPAEIQLNRQTIALNDTVGITSFTYTVPLE